MVSASALIDIFINVIFLIYGIIGAYVKCLMELFEVKPMKSLDSDIILITGAGNGLGKEMCLYLAESCPGATLICWDINWRDNEAIVGILKAKGIRAFGYKLDVGDKAQVVKAASQVREEVGSVTIIINNAGVLHRTDSFLNLSPVEIEKTFNVNTIAHCWILREFLPKMVERNSGHVVTICSVGGYMGSRNFSLYSASKCAVRGLIESIALEMQSQKIKINFTTVFPGFLNTQMIVNVRQKSSIPFLLRNTEPKAAAQEIVDSFRRNQEYVYIPTFTTRATIFLINLLLPKAGNAIKNSCTLEAADNWQ